MEGHAWKKSEALIKTVLQENPRDKRPLGRLRMRLENCVKSDVAEFYLDEDRHILAQNRNGWRQVCLDL